MPNFLRTIWERLTSRFRRAESPSVEAPAAPPVPGRPVSFSIPAPATLVGRIEKLEDEDRDMIHIAEEALRRGFPGQAHVAYWKAARYYTQNELPQKALAVLSSILRLAPNDYEAWILRGQTCMALDRRRDAAMAFHEAANIFESASDMAHALEMLERCVDLDPELEGLRLRYLRLGGTRDVWQGAPLAAGPQPANAQNVPAPRLGTIRSASVAMPRNTPASPLAAALMTPVPAPASSSGTPEAAVPPPRAASVQLPGPRALSVHMPVRPGSAGLPAITPRAPAASVQPAKPVEPEPELEDAPVPLPTGAIRIAGDDSGEIELELESSGPRHSAPPPSPRAPAPAPAPVQPVAPPPPAQVMRPPVRFAIPSAATTFEGGLPSALIGSEHERIASRELPAIVPDTPVEGDTDAEAATSPYEAVDDEPVGTGDSEARTIGYDISVLSKLIDKTKR